MSLGQLVTVLRIQERSVSETWKPTQSTKILLISPPVSFFWATCCHSELTPVSAEVGIWMQRHWSVLGQPAGGSVGV